MKEIVIISGKGGAGKTTVSAAVDDLFSCNAVAADCDVDAADLHILLKPSGGTTDDFYSGKIARVDAHSCTRCGICEQACRFNAVSHTDTGLAHIDPTACEGCAYCSRVCPPGAIKMEPDNVGTVFEAVAENGMPIVHARLKPSADNSGKLVTEVKKRAKRVAEETGRNLIIVDGAPGTGCPVVASLSGADLVLLVAECSISGFHDVQRVRDLAAKFSLPCALILNKSTLHEPVTVSVRTWAEKNEIPIVAELPYSSVFPESMKQRKTLTAYQPEGSVADALHSIETYITHYNNHSGG